MDRGFFVVAEPLKALKGVSNLMNLNGDHYKEFQEQNFILPDEEKGVICKATSEIHNHPENYKLKRNARVNDVKDREGEAVQPWDVIPERRLQPQESMICWERFLHLRSLKVLLVENDDSTRHIVSALLRNCSYEVIEAANGLQAWKILEDLNNHIDLILTEVVMPCFSGIGLLCKIMNHKTRNNIPVIMMSSHDSMGFVFKCLSKGAVDFLVKPVRKNELKILWQHVWRRCHTSSGSRSESDTQTQKSVKSKCIRSIENNIGSDHWEDNKPNLNIEDDSGNWSGTEDIHNGMKSDQLVLKEGSWTKQIVEIESSRDVSECADSTCAQVVLSKEKTFGENVHLPSTREFQEHNNRQGTMSKAASDSGAPSPELALKRQRNLPHNQNVTSRYHAASNFNHALTAQVEISPDIQSNSSGNPPNQSSNGDSNNIDMGSVTNNAINKSNTRNEYSMMVPKVHGSQVSPESKSAKADQISTPGEILLDNCDDMETAMEQAQSKDIKSLCDSHVRHLLHQQRLPSKNGDLPLKKMTVTLTHCESFNLDGPIEGNASNFSVHRRGSGSDPNSNEQKAKIHTKRKERCAQKENRKRLVEDLDSGDKRRKMLSKNSKEAGDD